MRIFILALTGTVAFASVVYAEDFKLGEIAGKPQAAVEKVLGKAEKCETVNPSRVAASLKCSFKGDQAEVVFIGGKADWITVRNPGVRFEKRSITYLGLQPKEPDFANNFVMRWNDIGGLHEVSAFPGSGAAVGYFYIKAFTD